MMYDCEEVRCGGPREARMGLRGSVPHMHGAQRLAPSLARSLLADDAEALARYDRFCVKAYVESSRDLRFCPAPVSPHPGYASSPSLC